MLELSAGLMVMTLVVFVTYGVFAAAVRTRVLARPRVVIWIRLAFAASFVAPAGQLALSDRRCATTDA